VYVCMYVCVCLCGGRGGQARRREEEAAQRRAAEDAAAREWILRKAASYGEDRPVRHRTMQYITKHYITVWTFL
jgi:hypothetical protein